MTSFDEIYIQNGLIMEELRGQSKPDNLYYFILYQHLKFAIGEFSQFCYKDLLDITPFIQTIDTYDSDGVETNFILESTPPQDAIFYVGVDGVKLSDSEFSYDELTNSITTSISGSSIYISGYIIGNFNVDLNLREIAILAEAMTETYLESFVNSPKQLEQVMYSGVDMFSQSQHNKVNVEAEKFRRSVSFKNMTYYSYGKDTPDTIILAKKAGVIYAE